MNLKLPSALIAVAMSACTSFSEQRLERADRVDAAWKQLEAAPECCSPLSIESFEKQVSSRYQEVSFPTDRAKRFAGKKAFFVGLRLPPYSGPYYVQIGSALKTPGIQGFNALSFFDPVVEVLDASLASLKSADHFSCRLSGILPREEMGYFGAIRIDSPDARFVLVHGDASDRNRKIVLTLHSSPMDPPWVPRSKEWQLPVTPAGDVGFRIAPTNLVAKLRKNADQGCKVVE